MAFVLYELRDHVATITLNRPEAHNAFSRDLLREMRDAFAEFRTDFDAWVAVVTGAGGKAFSAGADLKEMSARRSHPTDDIPRPSGFARLLSRDSSELFAGTTMWKPLVAAIDGYCLAGGLELALSCDIRIASPQSRFGLTEVTRGIIPGGGGTQRLTRALPMAVAMDLLLTGRHMDAEEALRCGLVNKLVPSDEVLPAAQEVAGRIAANAPLAVRATKEAALRGLGMTIDDGLRLEAHLSQMVAATEDAREGPKAFAEKRAPRWQGR